jgi:hypothetical protein
MSEDSRAQSELLGFLLIFGVVVLTIALLGTTGFVGLDNAQDYQRTANAEGAFTAFAGNLDDVIRGETPGRSTEIRITDASLSLREESSDIDVSVDGERLDLEGGNRTGAIVYDSGSNTTITYRGGALLRRDGGSSVMFREPDFLITDREVILPVVRLSPEQTGEIGGTSNVEVRTRHEETTVIAETEPVTDNVTISLGTPHVDAWTRYFEALEGEGPVRNVDPDFDGNSVEVEIETERLSVVIDRVSVTFR